MNTNSTLPETDHPMPEKQTPRIRFRLTGIVLLFLVVIALAAGWFPRMWHRAELNADTKKISIPSVEVVSPARGKAGAGLALPGEIKPWMETPIYSRASGFLKRRHVDIGAHVVEGQVLAEIDTPELDQELERARAQLAQAEANQKMAKTTASRWTQLIQSGSVSDQEVTEKKSDHELKSAVVDSARAEVRRLEKLKTFSKVTAPFAGTITARNIDTGDLIVGAGGKELFHLAQTERLRVFVQVPQAMARSMQPGLLAALTLPESAEKTYQAEIIRTAGAIADDSRTLLVELAVDNRTGEILAGSYSQVRFPESATPNTLMLPANALRHGSNGPQVYVVKDDGKIEIRNVQLGRDYGTKVEIVSGVGPDDRVVVNPLDSLTNGSLVALMAPSKQNE